MQDYYPSQEAKLFAFFTNFVANIDAGTYPNQLRADGKGNVWAVNKSRGENDEEGDRIWKITPKS